MNNLAVSKMDSLRFDLSDELDIEYAEASKFVSTLITFAIEVGAAKGTARQKVINALASRYENEGFSLIEELAEVYPQKEAMVQAIIEARKARHMRSQERAQREFAKVCKALGIG